jgi:hypothetical protein
MSVTVIRIEAPPEGELEASGQVTSATEEQISEEAEARQKFLDAVSPYFESLPKRPPTRHGGVTRVELLGSEDDGQRNHYLLLVTFDGEAGIDDLSANLPLGSKVSFLPERFQASPLMVWEEPL